MRNSNMTSYIVLFYFIAVTRILGKTRSVTAVNGHCNGDARAPWSHITVKDYIGSIKTRLCLLFSF